MSLLKEKHLETICNDYVVLDIETTGLSPENCEIIEIGALKVIDHKVVDTFNLFCKIKCKIPTRITKLTGITNKMLENSLSEVEVLLAFRYFCKDSVVVVHNSTFDINFLNTRYKINNIGTFDNYFIDTLKYSRKYFKNLKSHKLDLLAKTFNLRGINNHRAIYDALLTHELLLYLYNYINKQNKLLEI